MKNKLLLLSSLLIAGSSFTQTIFSENFDSGTTLPTGWVRHNVDGLTPATNVNYVNEAWVIRANSNTGTGNHAVSTSWYSPAGTSNDWLVSPQISIPASGNAVLEFDAMAPDGQYPDGFKVYISTGGSAVADFGTTPALTVAGAPQNYTNYSVNLSSYAGQTIRFAIRNDNNDRFLLFADNFVVRVPQSNDAALVSTSLNGTALINTNNTLGVAVKNMGTNAITSLTINWNDGTDHSATIATNIAIGATATVNHTTQVNYSTAQSNNINISISQVNGVADSDPSNNTGTDNIVTVSQLATKKVVIEEGTGTWCQWCPRGAVAMDYMDANFSAGFIGIAVHNGDPMAVSAYDAGVDFGGYPSAHVDRLSKDIDVSNSAFAAAYNAHKLLIPVTDVTVTPTVTGNTASIVASAKFYTNISSANYRLGVIIVEDGVTGTGSGYNQSNAYAGGGYGPMGGYESLPASVPAAQMVYNHVGRALLGGFSGQAGSIPTAITDQSVHNYTFNYTIPTTSNVNKMKAVAVVINNTTGEIVNANSAYLSPNVGVANVESIDLNVFPNPATDKVNVTFEAKGGNYTIDVIDLTGRMMSTEVVSNANGSQTVEINTSELKAGNYILTVSTEGSSFTKMIAIK